MERLSLACAIFALTACGGGTQEIERRPPSGPTIYLLTFQHESQMSETFRLVGLTARVGEQVVFEQSVDTEDGEGEAQIETPRCLLQQRVAAGSHDVSIELLYRGRGHGVFSYLRGYRFVVRSTHTVDVPSNVFGVGVTSIGSENGGVETPLEDRPAVRWVETPLRGDLDVRCGAGGAQPMRVTTPPE